MPAERSAEWPAAVAWTAMVLLVLFFLWRRDQTISWLLAAVVVVAGLACRNPTTALGLLPAAALLGPIATLPLPGGLIIHLGDIYLAALTLSFVLKSGLTFPLEFGRGATLLAILMGVVAVGWGVSVDPVAALPTAVGIAEFIAVYLITRYAVRSPADIDYVVNAWIAAVTLSSVLVFASYLKGDILILGASADARAQAASMRTSATLLFRASFFVPSFIFPLAATVSICAAKLMFEPSPKPSRKLLVTALLINTAAMVAMANATAVTGAAVSMASLVLFLPYLSNARNRFAIGALGTAVSIAILAFVVGRVLPAGQLSLLLGRANDTSSLEARLFVWKNVLRYLLDSPHALYLGLGPDVSIRLANSSLMRRLFLGGGLQQGAVDSGYLYLALDYGLVSLVVVVLIGIRSAFASFSSAVRGHPTGVLLWVTFVAWAIMSLTQQHGVSKPVFMIVQAVALADLLSAMTLLRARAVESSLPVDASAPTVNFS